MKKRIVQKHHIQYEHPEYKSMRDIVVYVSKGEHRILTLLQIYTSKFLSVGMVKALKIFLAQNEDRAVELRPEENN